MKKERDEHLGGHIQKRIFARGELLSLDGRLMDCGYATSLIKHYDRTQIKAPGWRIKESDTYLIANDFFALALTAADYSYAGFDSISLIDFENKQHRAIKRIIPFTRGKRCLPPSGNSGVVRAQGKNYEFTFRREGNQHHLYGHMYDFGGDRSPLLFDIILHDGHEDSLVITTPFTKKPHQFYYSQKINCMPADGRAIYQGRDYLFSPASSFGLLSWERAVLPYHTTGYWASASGVVQGHHFGFNLGYGIGDTSAATENTLFCDGKTHKLQDVFFDVPRSGQKFGYEKPWKIKDSQGRLQLSFVPILDCEQKFSVLVISTDQHQVFGRFSGNVTLDDGHVLEINELIGFARRVKNRY